MPIEERKMLIYGIHAVRASLATQRVERLFVAAARNRPAVDRIVAEAKARGIPIEYVPPAFLDRETDRGVHQGIAVRLEDYVYAEAERLFDDPSRAPLLLLDGIEDPHNLGAIVRTAHAAGAGGIVLPRHRSARVTPVVAKAAAGALPHIPIAIVTNLADAIATLQEKGWWIAGTDPLADASLYETDLPDPIVFVMGSEGRGLRRRVKGKCDLLLSIPILGSVGSLNVSVATGVVLYEYLRRQTAANKGETR
ncbi:MAG: 23S rRNA (guanosine(2251)-2'-O)-methyltransferase RlmB [Deltaproteobacteria bacterium]|nr:MAG: 23S rRNA (guanosine(2251)-2'-O)-methyltransferase RlmB [Deltaproteobacteria bacterium]